MHAALQEVWVLCRAPRSELVYLRYTLEAYDGLCLATTLSGAEGLVRLVTTQSSRHQLESVLEALAQEMRLTVERWGEGPHECG